MTRQTCNVDRDTATRKTPHWLPPKASGKRKEKKKPFRSHTTAAINHKWNFTRDGEEYDCHKMSKTNARREVPGYSSWNHIRIAWLREQRCWDSYTLCLDACVYLVLFRYTLPPVPTASPLCFEFVRLCFSQGACQLSDLLDAIKRILYHQSVIWLCFLCLSLSLKEALALFITVSPYTNIH